MIMDRRLSNVQQAQMRFDTEARRSQDSGTMRIQLEDKNNRGVVKHQPKSRSSADGSADNSSRGFPRSFSGYPTDSHWYDQSNEKRRRATLWEALAGLVCSLGALASRAAKMAARRNDIL
ncbi:hypothetical protein PV325_000796 [Microctonus aethiopoides]|uniref:Uncharacterized protein n=1 Tax=Microctonus aethiopoides TaxID=144406 RepID=A0AA39F6T2_9HYME|nr:hypothetical protein PV325_000796 [Microctonus aethiopoides]KAK0163985.1 hypothetical protein PV328_002660 [Microctonus aethiopoides]